MEPGVRLGMKGKAHRRSQSAPLELTVLASVPTSLPQGFQGQGGAFGSQSVPIVRAPDALLPANEATDAATPRASSNVADRFRGERDLAATPPQVEEGKGATPTCERRARAWRGDWHLAGFGGEVATPDRPNTLPKNPQASSFHARGSSDSTVGIGNSPQFERFNEGSKTEDERVAAAFSFQISDPARCGLSQAKLDPQALPRRDQIVRGGRDVFGRAGKEAGVVSEALDVGVDTTLETAQEGEDEDGEDDDTVVAGVKRRGGSLLDAYREPDGHDWGEFEDWQGLSGLGLAAGGGNREGMASGLLAPALAFRSGRVVEDDVLSLLGRPRSRHPGATSPTRQGLTSSAVDQVASDGGGSESARTDGVDDRGHGEPDIFGGDGVTTATTAAVAALEELGGAYNARGSGAQPILVSLADLTTAGLEKMLQAEGDSKMYFDPEAQRWVGEDVDLSGFEDTLPGQASSPSCFLPGSLASGDATAAGAIGPSPGRPRHAGSPRLRISPGAHRRWSSAGDGFANGLAPHVRTLSRGSSEVHSAAGKRGQTPPLLTPALASTQERAFHRRCSSSYLEGESRTLIPFWDKARLASVSRGSSQASSILRSNSDTGSILRLPGETLAEGELHLRRASPGSSSLLSNSDTGSVVRLLGETLAEGELRLRRASPGSSSLLSNSDTGSVVRLLGETLAEGELRLRRASPGSSSLRSNSDTGSVVRLPRENSAAEGELRRRRALPGSSSRRSNSDTGSALRLPRDNSDAGAELRRRCASPGSSSRWSNSDNGSVARLPLEGFAAEDERSRRWTSLRTSSRLSDSDTGSVVRLPLESSAAEGEPRRRRTSLGTSSRRSDSDTGSVVRLPRDNSAAEGDLRRRWTSLRSSSLRSDSDTGSVLRLPLESSAAEDDLRRRWNSPGSSSLRSDSDTGSVVRLPRESLTAEDDDGGRPTEAAAAVNLAAAVAAAEIDTGAETFASDAWTLFRRREGGSVWEDRLAREVSSPEAGLKRALSLRRSGGGSGPPVARGGGLSNAWLLIAPGVTPPALLYRGAEQVSESEMEASDASDWDQDSEFGELPDNQTFKLTFEQPEKFGYRPAAFMAGPGSGGGVRGGSGRERGSSLPLPLSHDPPEIGPGLFRHFTAPVNSGSSPILDRREAGPWSQWDVKVPPADSERGDQEGLGGHRRSFTDGRCDSLGSAAEWDQTLEGDLDLSLAQRPRAPSGSGAGWKPKPRAPSTSSPTTAISASPPHPPPRSVTKTGPTAVGDGDGSRCGGGGEVKVTCSGYKRNENGRTAVERVWQAFKAHRDDASIQATMRAAAAAATAAAKSIAFEHLMWRSRRVLTEKGSGPGKRLTGPVQITLEDLQTPHQPGRISSGEGGEKPGDTRSQSRGMAAATTGAYFNREKMRWEGFQEPDLDGFDTSDSESEPETGARSWQDESSRSPLRMEGVTRQDEDVDGGVKGRAAEPRSASRSPLKLSLEASVGMTSAGIPWGFEGRSPKDHTEALRPERPVNAGREEKKKPTREALVEVPSVVGGARVDGDFVIGRKDLREDGDNSRTCGDHGGGRGSVHHGIGVYDGPANISSAWGGGKGGVDFSAGARKPLGRGRDVHALRSGGCSPTAVEADRHGPCDRARGDRHDDGATKVIGVAQVFPSPRPSPSVRHPAEGVGEIATSAGRVGGAAGGFEDEDQGDDVNDFFDDADNSSISSDSIGEMSDWDKSLGSPRPGPLAYAGQDGDSIKGGQDGSPNARVAKACMVSSLAPAVTASPCAKHMPLAGLGRGGVLIGTQPRTRASMPTGRGGNSAALLKTVEASAEAEERESKAAGAGMLGVGTMVTRSIYGGRSVESTEDDTVDDWGADFMDVIVLSPKARRPEFGWRRGPIAFEEENEEDDYDEDDDLASEEDMESDDSRMATCDESPPRSRHTTSASGSSTLAQLQDLFDESSPHHDRPDPFTTDDDEMSWSAPEMSAGSEAGVPSGGAGTGAEAWACEAQGSLTRNRWRNYGPAIKRVSDGIWSGVFSRNRKRIVGLAGPGYFSSAEEDEGDEDWAGGTERRDKLEHSRRRSKRSRGYQTITKAEYTPIYVPHAWLNPKTDSWEPVDGFEVDMSGFGGDSDNDSSIPTSTSLRRKVPPPLSLAAAAAAPAAGERSHGAGGSTRSDGSWTGSVNSPPLARRASGSSAGTTSGTPSSRETRKPQRENAFRLSPETKRRFARNEEDHDRAMALFLGEKVYTCAKHKGAARLQRLPGVFGSGEEVKPTFLHPEPIPFPSPSPRPRMRSLGAGFLTTWARSGSKGSVDSGIDSPPLCRGSKDSKDGASGGSVDHGGDVSSRGTPSRTRGRKAAVRTFSGTFPTTPGSGGDEGVSDVSVSGAIGAGGILSRPRRPSASSAREGKSKQPSPSPRRALLSSGSASVKVTSSSKSPSSRARTAAKPLDSTVVRFPAAEANTCAGSSPDRPGGDDARESDRLRNLEGSGRGSDRDGGGSDEGTGGTVSESEPGGQEKAGDGALSDFSKEQHGGAAETDGRPSPNSRGSGGVIHSNPIVYSSRASAAASAPNRLSAWPEVPQPRRREGRRIGFQRGAAGWKSSGSLSRSASGNISGGGSGSIRRSGSVNGGAGKSRNVFSGAARKASSPMRSSHVLRSPPRRGLTEASARVGSRLRRRATISTPPFSPRVARSHRMTRTLSTDELPSRVSSRNSRSRLSLAGRAEGVAEDTASVLAEERERVEMRLARIDEITAFAANTIKERFFLPGARNFSEATARRTHRRRRSGGESSAGSGSSTGLAVAIGGLTVRR